MGYIEVGATFKADGKPVPTKKALRDALSQDLASVVLTSVGGLNAAFSGHVGNLAGTDTTLIVCGPDPFTRRNWWANLKIRRLDGKVLMDDKPIKPVLTK